LGDIEIVIQAALSQQGKPYQWASATTVKTFDSSELTQWAFGQAGAKLPRGAAGQYKLGPIVPAPRIRSLAEWLKVLERGDLIYWGASPAVTSGAGATHVALYLGNGQMIDATSPTSVVAVRDVPWTMGPATFYGATRTIENGSPAAKMDGWRWPLTNTTVTSQFGMRFHPVLHQWRLHDGVDFGASIGTPVFAAQDGTVVFVGPNGGGGNTITIDHGGGIQTSYLHLSSFQSTRVGMHVKSGQQIALSGNTGWSTGPHLHFRVRVKGNPTNPLTFMRQFGLVP
jgi:cell wall-associated NlpC family hydrolase